MPSDEARVRMFRIITHAAQAARPDDLPPDFVRSERADTLDDRFLPWWFGPTYQATPEALAEFSQPLRAYPQADEQDFGI